MMKGWMTRRLPHITPTYPTLRHTHIHHHKIMSQLGKHPLLQWMEQRSFLPGIAVLDKNQQSILLYDVASLTSQVTDVQDDAALIDLCRVFNAKECHQNSILIRGQRYTEVRLFVEHYCPLITEHITNPEVQHIIHSTAILDASTVSLDKIWLLYERTQDETHSYDLTEACTHCENPEYMADYITHRLSREHCPEYIYRDQHLFKLNDLMYFIAPLARVIEDKTQFSVLKGEFVGLVMHDRLTFIYQENPDGLWQQTLHDEMSYYVSVDYFLTNLFELIENHNRVEFKNAYKAYKKPQNIQQMDVKDFIRNVEQDHQIAGFFYRDPENSDHVFYELNKLSAIISNRNGNQIAIEWNKTWNRDDLAKSGYVYKPEKRGSAWYITAEHFLTVALPKIRLRHLNRYGTCLLHQFKGSTVPNAVKSHPVWSLASEASQIYEFTKDEAIHNITSTLYLKSYFKYHLASKEYFQRVYGCHTELFDLDQLVHVAGPYNSLADAQKSLKETTSGTPPNRFPDASKGHVTLLHTDANNYQKSKQLISIEYFLYSGMMNQIGKSDKCWLAAAWRQVKDNVHQLHLNGSSQLATATLENARKIQEQGSVEDHRIRAEVLEEQENQFAEEFLDARDEAANVRTVTDENILDAAAAKGHGVDINSVHFEQARAKQEYYKHLQSVEETKRKELEEGTKRKKLEEDTKHKELEEETNRKELDEETKRKELDEQTKCKELEEGTKRNHDETKKIGIVTTQVELTKRALERTKQMELKVKLVDKRADDVPARHATEAASVAPKKRGRPKGSGKHQKAAREREAEAAKPFQPPHYSENWVANDRPMRGRPSSPQPVAEDQS